MKTALFVNFTDEAFSCSWDGKTQTFKAGEKKFMPDFLAAHFAKHLANRELLKQGHETATSPKKPEQVPQFKELFDKACIVEDEQTEKNQLETEVEIANKSRVQTETKESKSHNPSSDEPQIIEVPEEDDEDEVSTESSTEENEEFEGLKS